MIKATPCKLRNGRWGARAPASTKAGDTLTITTKAGKSWQAVVDCVVWTGDGVALCATSKLESAPLVSQRFMGGSRRGGSTRTGCHCGSREEDGETLSSPNNCRSCRFEAEDH